MSYRSISPHFTTLHPITLHYTSPNYTSLHLSTLQFFPLKLHPTTPRFTSLHFTTLSFGLTPLKFPTAPHNHLTSPHFTSLPCTIHMTLDIYITTKSQRTLNTTLSQN